jgi:hypothetical protein
MVQMRKQKQGSLAIDVRFECRCQKVENRPIAANSGQKKWHLAEGGSIVSALNSQRPSVAG